MEWVLFATGWWFMAGFSLIANRNPEIPLWFNIFVTFIFAPIVFCAAIWEVMND